MLGGEVGVEALLAGLRCEWEVSRGRSCEVEVK